MLPDASFPPTGGVDGSAGLPSDASADQASLSPDAPAHTDGRLWTRFPPASYNFTKCTWLSKDEGYCNDAPSMLGTARVYLYKTLDGGASWMLTCTIDSEIPDINANINVYVLSQSDFWFVAGSGNVGSVGRSADGGKNWTSLTSDIAGLLTASGSGDAGVASVPVWQLAAQGGRIWLLPQGPNLAFSPDGGRTWKKFTPPADFGASGKRSMVASKNSLLLQYLASDGSLGLYTWNGTVFLPAESLMPASSAGSHVGTWSRAWPSAEGAFFADRGPLPAWGSPFAAYATIDGGKSLLKLLPGVSGSSDIVGLSDGMAFSAYGSVTAYVSGIFKDASGGRFLEIRRTVDAGKTWTTLHSEPSYLGDASLISLSKDGAGEVHAMRFQASTDGIGPPVIYDAHYVLQ
jgi:photosystem II stability/assembly factor-like uncharacterized protein